MPDYTTRLGLAKPSDGENYDVDIVNANSDIVDGAVGAKNVTSTTRPATPYIGQVIYETDTKVVRMWNGSRWNEIPTQGKASFATQRSDTVQVGNADSQLLELTGINPGADTYYEVSGFITTYSNSVAETMVTLSLRMERLDGTGGETVTFSSRANSVAAGQSNNSSGRWFFYVNDNLPRRVRMFAVSLQSGVFVYVARASLSARLN